MKLFRSLLLAVALLWNLGLLEGAGDRSPEEKPAGEKVKKGLIRKDLLRPGAGEARLPKRNIFSPRSSLTSPVLAPSQTPLSVEQSEGQETPGGTAGTPPPITINLRYIGYIESSRKMIALIILEGQALAVAEGEWVGEAVKIGKITTTEIEIVLPDSTTRKFSLEGE